MNITLPTLSDYILNLKKIWDTEGLSGNEFRSRTLKYVNFLLLKLELWMFIPCGEDGKPLKEPIENNYNLGDIHSGYFRKKLEEYQRSQERVIFKGFEYEVHYYDKDILHYYLKYLEFGIMYNTVSGTFYDLNELLTIESIQDLTGEVDLVEWKHKEFKL